MIDPVNFTDYNRTIPQLQETLLFSALVAGHNALSTARALDRFLDRAYEIHGTRRTAQPFPVLKHYTVPRLAGMLKDAGIGCYNRKCVTVYEIARCGLDLKTCTTDDLERIYGIGPKTSRLFILHTRPQQRLAVIDTHILKYLRDLGYHVPQSTPSSPKRYKQLEEVCLRLADDAGIAPADWDLRVWNAYRRSKRG